MMIHVQVQCCASGPISFSPFLAAATTTTTVMYCILSPKMTMHKVQCAQDAYPHAT